MMAEIGRRARQATPALASSSTETRNTALTAAANALRACEATLLEANEKDMKACQTQGLSGAMLDRLKLNPERVEGMAKGLEDIAALADPLGSVIAQWQQPNGLEISRVRVPLGVIGIIYESRPNVTADAGALCLKSGNAVILRGGSESFHSSRAIHACLIEGLKQAGLPEQAIQIVPTTDRAAVGAMLKDMADYIDVIIPRGGKNLIARVQTDARIPVMGHLEGLCHIYIDHASDIKMAKEIVVNAKMRRTGICGAVETILIDRAALSTHATPIIDALIAAGCEVRGGDDVQSINSKIVPATEADWTTEYLDAIVSVRAVDGVEGAIKHIETYGSNHTESIITDDPSTAEKFLNDLDSAIVMHNVSTQFADGGEFGMGAEIGIATGKLHARGPVGAEQLTSYKYVVRGSGQIRP